VNSKTSLAKGKVGLILRERLNGPHCYKTRRLTRERRKRLSWEKKRGAVWFPWARGGQNEPTKRNVFER